MNDYSALQLAMLSRPDIGLTDGQPERQARASGKPNLAPSAHQQSQLLAVASHDLRQPVHALGLYIAELRRKISGEDQHYLIGQAERSVDAITRLLNALLDISRLDSGIVQPQKVACDIALLLERIVANFQIAAHNKNIRLVVRPFHGLAISDPVLLERIVMNLVGNALRYTRPFGTVLIACRRRGRHLLIEVRDNGIGIEKSQQTNIFREFVQLNGQQSDEQKGMGLGLAIVDRLVKLLGHRISLRSAPGRGSSFTLQLDDASMLDRRMATVGRSATEPAGSFLAGKKILIVDGDSMVLDGTARMLTSWGGEISAATGYAAVQQLLGNGAAWDIVISDYRLTDNWTGLELMQTVRRVLADPTPCILISGDTSACVRDSTQGAGHYFLSKPVKPAKLRSLLQYLLSNTSPVDRLSPCK